MKPFAIALAALGLVAGAGMSAPKPAAKSAAKTHAKTVALVCPVTGTKIPNVKAAVGHSTYNGKTYYFCCGSCKPKFDKAPAKYVKNAAKGIYEKM